MKHRIFYPIVIFITAILALTSINIFTVSDFYIDSRTDHLASISERNLQKINAMRLMSDDFFLTSQESDSIFIAKLHTTHTNVKATYFVAKYNPAKGFPIILSPPDADFATVQEMIEASYHSVQNSEFYKDINSKITPEEAIIVRDINDNMEYLLTWVIVPSVGDSKYVYYSFEEIKALPNEDKYKLLIMGNIIATGILLIILPIAFWRLEKWISGRPSK